MLSLHMIKWAFQNLGHDGHLWPHHILISPHQEFYLYVANWLVGVGF